jgi:hypothetical protein
MNTNTPSSSNEGLSATKKVPPPTPVKTQTKGILTAIVIGVGLVSLAIVSGGTSLGTGQGGNAARHASYVLDFIKSKATHPSTVDFCSSMNMTTKVDAQPDGSFLYGYRNCMTAKNSFGLELTYDWVVVLQESKNGDIKVANWSIDEK